LRKDSRFDGLRGTLPKEGWDVALALVQGEDKFLLRRLRRASFVGVRYDYLFVGTPKSGVTSIKAALWHIEELGESPDSVDLHRRKDALERPSATTIGVPEAIATLTSPDHFRFTCWRDPVDRLVSAYRDKIAGRQTLSKSTAADRAAIASRLNRDDDGEISFDEFADFACAQPDEDRNIHWMSQHRVALHGYIDYHKIVTIENFVEDMTVVLDTIGVPRSRRPDLALRHNRSSSQRPLVQPSTAEKIRNAYSLDYGLVAARP
jgi:hypothetical protein